MPPDGSRVLQVDAVHLVQPRPISCRCEAEFLTPIGPRPSGVDDDSSWWRSSGRFLRDLIGSAAPPGVEPGRPKIGDLHRRRGDLARRSERFFSADRRSRTML